MFVTFSEDFEVYDCYLDPPTPIYIYIYIYICIYTHTHTHTHEISYVSDIARGNSWKCSVSYLIQIE